MALPPAQQPQPPPRETCQAVDSLTLTPCAKSNHLPFRKFYCSGDDRGKSLLMRGAAGTYLACMNQKLDWLEERDGESGVVCPSCGNDACRIQSVAVLQRGLDVAVARRHVLVVESGGGDDGYSVDIRLFCNAGHRFAIHFELTGQTAAVRCETLGAGLPLLDLER